MTRQPYVAVVGAAVANDDELAWAEDVGRLLAENHAVLVCGGLGGVMDAAARGCESAGGLSVGILPGEFRAGASTHLTITLPTGIGEARNTLVVRAADVVIAVGGEFGTLSEIAFALKMGTPVVGLESWRLERDGLIGDPIQRAETPSEAVARALAMTRTPEAFR